MTMLEFQNVSYQYPSEDFDIIDHLSFAVEPGSFHCIIGISGCGKSTIFRMTNGLLQPKGGTILVEGTPIAGRKRYCGYMPQKDLLFPWRTVGENVALPLEFKGVPKQKRVKEAKRMLKAVNLEERMLHKPTQMSGGQQQRVGIARAFVAKPKIVFADEPTGNLDSKTTKEVMEMIVGIARRHNETLILVTHDRDIAQYADRIVHLVDGDIVSDEKNQSTITRADAEAEVHTAEKKEALPVEKNVDLSGDKLA